MGKPTVQLPDPPDTWDIDPSSIPGLDQNPNDNVQAAPDSNAPAVAIRAPDVSNVPDINPDDLSFQAPSIMGDVDFSGGDLPMRGQGSSGNSSGGLADIAGKIWNLPNTALGLAYGGAGYLAGQVDHALGGQDKPGIQFGNNAIQFTNNPFGGNSAITIGNAEVFGNDPAKLGGDNNSFGQHEEQHTYQGEQLGPLYLPSNLLGGIAAEVLGGNWHTPQNWNETGPQQHPPVPWPK